MGITYFLNLGRSFQFITIRFCIGWVFIIDDPTWEVLLYSHYFIFFRRRNAVFSQIIFLHLLRLPCVFPFYPINVACNVDLFLFVKPTLPSCDKSKFVIVYNPFYMLLDSVWQYLVEDFIVYVNNTYLSSTCFSIDLFVWFLY